jgi:hypothetical protein
MYKKSEGKITEILMPSDEDNKAARLHKTWYKSGDTSYQGEHNVETEEVEGRIIILIPGVLLRVGR